MLALLPSWEEQPSHTGCKPLSELNSNVITRCVQNTFLHSDNTYDVNAREGLAIRRSDTRRLSPSTAEEHLQGPLEDGPPERSGLP